MSLTSNEYLNTLSNMLTKEDASKLCPILSSVENIEPYSFNSSKSPCKEKFSLHVPWRKSNDPLLGTTPSKVISQSNEEKNITKSNTKECKCCCQCRTVNVTNEGFCSSQQSGQIQPSTPQKLNCSKYLTVPTLISSNNDNTICTCPKVPLPLIKPDPIKPSYIRCQCNELLSQTAPTPYKCLKDKKDMKLTELLGQEDKQDKKAKSSKGEQTLSTLKETSSSTSKKAMKETQTVSGEKKMRGNPKETQKKKMKSSSRRKRKGNLTTTPINREKSKSTITISSTKTRIKSSKKNKKNMILNDLKPAHNDICDRCPCCGQMILDKMNKKSDQFYVQESRGKIKGEHMRKRTKVDSKQNRKEMKQLRKQFDMEAAMNDTFPYESAMKSALMYKPGTKLIKDKPISSDDYITTFPMNAPSTDVSSLPIPLAKKEKQIIINDAAKKQKKIASDKTPKEKETAKKNVCQKVEVKSKFDALKDLTSSNDAYKKIVEYMEKEKKECKALAKVAQVEGIYPGMRVGHKTCCLPPLRVPPYMGWLWNVCEGAGKTKPNLDWKPGAIRSDVYSIMTKAKGEEEEGEKRKGENDKEKGEESECTHDIEECVEGKPPVVITDKLPTPKEINFFIEREEVEISSASTEKPTLQLQKTKGKYCIRMNPPRDKHRKNEDNVVFSFDPKSLDTDGSRNTDTTSTVTDDSLEMDYISAYSVYKNAPKIQKYNVQADITGND